MGFFQDVSARTVKEAVPKLQVVAQRLGEAPVGLSVSQKVFLTYVDGRVAEHNLNEMKVADIRAEIEVETGRLDMEAMKAGKPW